MSEASRPFDHVDHHAFADGLMDLDRRAAFVQALAGDPELKRRLDGWRAQNEALLSTFGPVLSETPPVRLMPTNPGPDPRAKRRLPMPPAAAPVRVRDRRNPANSLVGAALVSFLVGALLAFGIVEAGVGEHRGARPNVQDASLAGFGRALAQRAYEAHETYALDLSHPVEIAATDRVALIRWIQHRLALPVRIPDLKAEGWELLGGRVLPGDLGPAAYLLYTNGIERLGLYLSRTNARQSDGVSIYDNGAALASVAFWTDEPIGYALTTSRDSAWLQRSAPAIIGSIRTQVRDGDLAN